MAEWDEKRNIVQRYDLTSQIYDLRYAEDQIAKIEAAIKSTTLGKEVSVLDVGCGTGLLFKYVANRAGAVVALDVSRNIMLEAKRRADRFPNVHLILADADNMPLKAGIFRYLYAITVIQNLPNPLKTLIEIKRVVMENGLMVITGLKKKFTGEAFERLFRNSGLNPVILEDDSLKCRIAVCTKV